MHKYSKWARHVHVDAARMSCDAMPGRVPFPAGARHLHASLYSDGASRGNPGRAACGGVIYLSKHKPNPSTPPSAPPIHSYGMCIGTVTNNEAEYRGLLAGLRAARTLGITHLTAHVDSSLVCQQIQGGFAVHSAALSRFHAECKTLIAMFHSFRIVHVLRDKNAAADAMCNHALDTDTVTDHSTPISEHRNRSVSRTADLLNSNNKSCYDNNKHSDVRGKMMRRIQVMQHRSASHSHRSMHAGRNCMT